MSKKTKGKQPKFVPLSTENTIRSTWSIPGGQISVQIRQSEPFSSDALGVLAEVSDTIDGLAADLREVLQ